MVFCGPKVLLLDFAVGLRPLLGYGCDLFLGFCCLDLDFQIKKFEVGFGPMLPMVTSSYTVSCYYSSMHNIKSHEAEGINDIISGSDCFFFPV